MKYFSDKDGYNMLKFHLIDLLDAVIQSAQDPTLDHTFEASHDQEGNRMFDKANPGLRLVFETFYLLDTESEPSFTVVGCDASFQGNTTQHLLYCK